MKEAQQPKPLSSEELRRRVDDYIARCVREETAPRVKELALELGSSRPQLSRRFANDVGTPLGAYFRHAQVEYACMLLETTTGSTTRIGYASGFETRATFYRVFRELVGCTPATYRDGTRDVDSTPADPVEEQNNPAALPWQ
jgi:AraC-like DNA-binding protein